MLAGIGCAAKVPLQLLKRYEALPERYKKPYKSRAMQKETGHQSRYALYQNWCPVMVESGGVEPPSENKSTRLSTRLFNHLNLPRGAPIDRITLWQPFSYGRGYRTLTQDVGC